MKTITINNETIYVNTIRDLTDTQREDIAERLVKNEVYCQCTSEVEYILKSSEENDSAPFSSDDLVCSRFAEVEVRGDYIEVDDDNKEELIESLLEGRDILESRLSVLETHLEDCPDDDYDRVEDLVTSLGGRIDILNESIENLESAYFDPEEVYQWFSCSTWFAEKMSVRINGWGHWGRTSWGQSISLDAAVQDLAFETFSRELTAEVKHPDNIDFSNTDVILALSYLTYPFIDKMKAGSISQYNYVKVCNELYKRQRVPKMVCNSGKYSLQVLDKSGEVIDTVLTVARLGSTKSSSFNIGLVEYLEDIK